MEFENPHVSIAKLHATTMFLFLMTLFYLPLMPLAPVIGLGGTIFSYAVEKYLLLRRFKIPEQFGPDISRFFLTLTPYSMLLFSLSSLFFVSNLSERIHPQSLVSVAVPLVFICLPIRRAIARCCVRRAEKSSDETYEKHLANFHRYSDYDLSNPLTRPQGEER